MRTQTHMLNPNPLRCSAYHEAGHAVVAIIGGIKLKIAAMRPSDGSDPQCRWDGNYINPILTSGSPKEREAFTQRFAENMLCKSTFRSDGVRHEF